MRRLKWMGKLALLLALACVLTVLVNRAAETAQRRWHLEKDLSFNALTALSEQTVALLRKLETPVELYVMQVDGLQDRQAEQVAQQYALYSDRVRVSLLDPNENPVLMKVLNPDGKKITAGSVAVTNADHTSARLILADQFILYGSQTYNGETYSYKAGYQYEQLLDSAILTVTDQRIRRVCLLEGHGELSSSEAAAIQATVQSCGYAWTDGKRIADAVADQPDAMLLLSPSRDLTQEETEQLRAYLSGGGSLLVTVDPGRSANEQPLLQQLLSYFGLAFSQELVIADPQNPNAYYPGNPAMIVSYPGSHSLLDGLREKNGAVLLSPQCLAVSFAGMDRNELRRWPLLMTDDAAYGIDVRDTGRATIEKQSGDREGVFYTAVAAEAVRNFENELENGRLILLGSSNLINNAAVNRSFSNEELSAALFRWLTRDADAAVSVGYKSAARAGLSVASQQLQHRIIACLMALPAVILLAGAVVYIRRKHQ